MRWHEDVALAPCIRGHFCPPLQVMLTNSINSGSKEAWENTDTTLAYTYDKTETLMSN